MSTRAENNFNLLRLVFALMVVIYHGIVLPGVAGFAAAEGWAGVLAEVGVQGFFVVSGYLVWSSLERSSSLRLYAEKRVRRLYPAYAAVVIVCALLAVAFVPAARADLAGVASYLGWNLAFLNFLAPGLPGVFEANRFTEINGALWTLKIEVMFYLVLPLLAWLLRAFGKARWLLVVVIYIAAVVWRWWCARVASTDPGVWLELSRQLPGQMSFFISGIALCAWRDKLNWRSTLPPLGLLLFTASIVFKEAEPLRAAGLAILIGWIAVGMPRLFDAARFGDLSYGLYLVHFPIIQTTIAVGLFASSSVFGLSVAGAASLVAALLLWWLVERPALRSDSLYRAATG